MKTFHISNKLLNFFRFDISTFATKMRGTVTKNKKDSAGRRLGPKKSGNQEVFQNDIIVRQRGFKYKPGENVHYGRDQTLHASVEGKMVFHYDPWVNKKKTRVSVIQQEIPNRYIVPPKPYMFHPEQYPEKAENNYKNGELSTGSYFKVKKNTNNKNNSTENINYKIISPKIKSVLGQTILRLKPEHLSNFKIPSLFKLNNDDRIYNFNLEPDIIKKDEIEYVNEIPLELLNNDLFHKERVIQVNENNSFYKQRELIYLEQNIDKYEEVYSVLKNKSVKEFSTSQVDEFLSKLDNLNSEKLLLELTNPELISDTFYIYLKSKYDFNTLKNQSEEILANEKNFWNKLKEKLIFINKKLQKTKKLSKKKPIKNKISRKALRLNQMEFTKQKANESRV